MDKTTNTPKQAEQASNAPLASLTRLVMWRAERVKDANGFVAKRLLGWLLRRDMILLGSSFAMDYGKFKKYLHPSEVILTT